MNSGDSTKKNLRDKTYNFNDRYFYKSKWYIDIFDILRLGYYSILHHNQRAGIDNIDLVYHSDYYPRIHSTHICAYPHMQFVGRWMIISRCQNTFSRVKKRKEKKKNIKSSTGPRDTMVSYSSRLWTCLAYNVGQVMYVCTRRTIYLVYQMGYCRTVYSQSPSPFP